MKVSRQRTRQLTCVAIILALTTVVSLSIATLSTSAAGGPTNLDATAIPFYSPPPPVIPNTGTADEMTYTLPGGDGNNLPILEDDGVPGNGMSQLRSGNGSFDTVIFAHTLPPR
jgi:hypothetical protein